MSRETSVVQIEKDVNVLSKFSDDEDMENCSKTDGHSGAGCAEAFDISRLIRSGSPIEPYVRKTRHRKDSGSSDGGKLKAPKCRKKIDTEDDLQELRVKINSRERKRMHDLNSALDCLRQVMPYGNGPSVRKISKISTLVLARNYIMSLTSTVKDLQRIVGGPTGQPPMPKLPFSMPSDLSPAAIAATTRELSASFLGGSPVSSNIPHPGATSSVSPSTSLADPVSTATSGGITLPSCFNPFNPYINQPGSMDLKFPPPLPPLLFPPTSGFFHPNGFAMPQFGGLFNGNSFLGIPGSKSC